MRIVHITPALVTGGAQMMLAKLIEADGGRHQQMVVALRPGGALWPRVAATGVDMHDLGLMPGQISPNALWRLVRLLRDWKPDLVHGWMYHGNAAALMAAMLTGTRPPVLWNIRHSLHDPGLEKRATRLVIRAGAGFSGFVSGLVYNSSLAARQHQAYGYTKQHSEVIPNGFDTDRFKPDPAARQRLQAELGLHADALLIGHVARYHPMKDHRSLLLAGQQLRRSGLDIVLVMTGDGVTPHNPALNEAIAAAGLTGRVRLLGDRPDVAEIMAGLDVLTLCSAWGEGFPNVIGEAMSAGVPCVATDVGDCRPLLDRVGYVVPPSVPAALAGAIERLLRLPIEQRRARGLAGRDRIVSQYSLPAIADRYAQLYCRLARPAATAIAA